MDAAGIQRSRKQRKGAAATNHSQRFGKFCPNVMFYGLSSFFSLEGSPKIDFEYLMAGRAEPVAGAMRIFHVSILMDVLPWSSPDPPLVLP